MFILTPGANDAAGSQASPIYSALTCATSRAAHGMGVSLRLACAPPEVSSGVKMLRLMQTQSSAWLLGRSQPTAFPAVAPGAGGLETLVDGKQRGQNQGRTLRAL